MVRGDYIRGKVLEIYRRMDAITYPIQPSSVLPCLAQNCRILSYQKLAQINRCNVRDIAIMCKSDSGATHYDVGHNRYLILYDASMLDGRVLWTICHEIGHICLGHFEDADELQKLCENERAVYQMEESEADFFAWNLIAPLPAMWEMDVPDASEAQRRYGLSKSAAIIHFKRYAKWARSCYWSRTRWEDDMISVLRKKYMGRLRRNDRYTPSKQMAR